MSNFSSEEDISNLKRAFKASSLATPTRGAVTVDLFEPVDNAIQRLSAGGFDQAPVKNKKKLAGWVSTEGLQLHKDVRRALQPLEDSVLISSESSLSNAIRKLNEVAVVFTVSEGGIDGFVCVSDLERHIVRAYFSVLTSQIEILLGAIVKSGVEESYVLSQISQKTTHQDGISLYKKFEQAKMNRVDTHPVEYLYLEQLVDLLKHVAPPVESGVLRALRARLKVVVQNRNQIAHATRRLSAPNELLKLDEAFDFLLHELMQIAELRAQV